MKYKKNLLATVMQIHKSKSLPGTTMRSFQGYLNNGYHFQLIDSNYGNMQRNDHKSPKKDMFSP